jgi:hypothetical protein
MNTNERNEFKQRVRAKMNPGLSEQSFGDLALLYATLEDPTLDGESMQRLKPYETREGWARLRANAEGA